MSVYIGVVECDNDYIFIGDIRTLTTEGLPIRQFRGLYKVDINHTYMRLRNQHIFPHVKPRFEQTEMFMVELQIANRYWYDRKDNVKYGTGKEWYKVMAGDEKKRRFLRSACASYKWASRDPDRYTFSSNSATNYKLEQIYDRPLCHHGYPCEVRSSRCDDRLYFDCALKYIWPSLLPDVDHGTPCDFHEDIKLE
jgi:hypothetical protein